MTPADGIQGKFRSGRGRSSAGGVAARHDPPTVLGGTAGRAAHFDWGEDGSRLHFALVAKDDGPSVVTVEHARFADAAARDQAKGHWRDRLSALKRKLERANDS